MDIRSKAVMVLALVGGSLAGCESSSDSQMPERAVRGLVSTPPALLALKEPHSCGALNEFLTNAITGLILDGVDLRCPDCPVPFEGDVVTTTQPTQGTDQQSFERFTETNNQEAGVDELDQIETDADGYFYFIDGDQLVVADGLPPAGLRVVAQLEVGDSTDGLLLDPVNRRLVVARSIPDGVLMIWPPQRITAFTELMFVNVANPAAPVIERRLKVEGFELTARRVGRRVHLLTHETPFLPLPIVNDAELATLRERLAGVPEGSAQRQRLADQIRGRVAAHLSRTDLLDYLPNLAVSTGGEEFTDVTPADCSNVVIPEVAMRLAWTAVTSVDSDGTDVASLTVANSSWNAYASGKHVYLNQTSDAWWFDGNQRQQTVIYKIEVGAGRPAYRAFGVVDGGVRSRFQFSEYDGFLRVATSRREFDSAAGRQLEDNHLYVLGDDGAGELEVVGAVNGFGEGERIYAARFLGTRGFVVTFRQIDPLFTFDLSVPQDPRLVGQVEIPGVSTYVHPLDDAHLLTIGYDGDRTWGQFQLQIFDVQSLAEPRLLHKLVPTFEAPGFAWTSATRDPLAFNYFPEAGTLTVPVQHSASSLGDHFSGFIAFSVSAANGFSELGRLDHSDLARAEYCTTPTGVVPPACSKGLYLGAAQPRRAVSAQLDGATYIYTLSNVGMKVSAAPTFGTAIATLPLPGGNVYPWLAQP